MHVIKEFATSVLVHNVIRPVEWINQMPMPMMQVNTDVFAEIADFVFHVQVVCGIIVRYFDGCLNKNDISIREYYSRPNTFIII